MAKPKLEIVTNADADAVEINKAYRRGRDGLIDAGKMLVEQQSVKHGEFDAWLEISKETLKFGRRTAYRLMSLYKASVAGDTIDDLWGHNTRGTTGTGDNEWFTPAEYVELARKVLEDIDLDPATHVEAQKIVQAKKFFTKKEDGLRQEWHGRIWLNPPYAQPLIGQFIGKLLEELEADRVISAIALTHNYTDTSWFHQGAEIASAICFTRGRIAFLDVNGKEAAPTQGQAFFYFGDDIEKFSKAFVDVGFVVRP